MMSTTLVPNAPESLPNQLQDLLLRRINHGAYQPGRRIDSIRNLSRELGVSTLVVVKAIALLEQQGVLVRVPAKGVFVAEDYRPGLSTCRIALVFPESAISLDVMPAENWSIVSEIHRGLLAGAAPHRAQVRFEHFSESQSDLQVKQHLRRLDEYDAAVFLGHQLRKLRVAAARQKPVIQIGKDEDVTAADGFTTVIDYDRDDALRQLVRHVVAQGYERCGVLTFRSASASARQQASLRAKVGLYRQALLDHGLGVSDSFMCEVNPTQAIVPRVTAWLQQSDFDFVFCNGIDPLLENLYQAACEQGLLLGADLGVACIASGLTLQGVSPTCTFLKPPWVEAGRTAIDTVMRQFASEPGDPHPSPPLLEATLVPGQSTASSVSHAPDAAARQRSNRSPGLTPLLAACESVT